MTQVSERLASVRSRISAAARAAGRDPATISLLAVSKRQPLSRIREGLAAGLTDLGENYVQEGVAKISELGRESARWHFIGQLQTNKTRDVARWFDWVHSIDRLKVARRLSEQRSGHAEPINVCLQIRLEDREGRGGCAPGQAADLAAGISELTGLRLRGLMAVPPVTGDPDEQRAWFRRLATLQAALNATGLDLDTLSMGMSGDLESAVAEGATILRIGTAIFGPRAAAD
jgi:pyridoxal phosphate enzyme (YggS family)